MALIEMDLTVPIGGIEGYNNFTYSSPVAGLSGTYTYTQNDLDATHQYFYTACGVSWAYRVDFYVKNNEITILNDASSGKIVPSISGTTLTITYSGVGYSYLYLVDAWNE